MKLSLKKLLVSLALFLIVFGMNVALAETVGVVTANGGLNLRISPSTSSEVIMIVPSGSILKIAARENGWMWVAYDGKAGFVSEKYVKEREAASPSRGGITRTMGDGKGAEIVEFAKQFVGTPYKYGGNSPGGFDCSGFVQYVYSQFGYELNRTAPAQMENGVYVAKSELQPGDLVFFKNGGSGVGHSGIYVGDGYFIHARNPSNPLSITSLDDSYYLQNYVSARRIIQ